MKNIYFLLSSILATAFVIGYSANIVFAQDEAVMKGTEKPTFQNKTDTKQCYVFSKYIVKTTSSEDVGEDISVYKRAVSTGAEAGCKVKSSLLFTIKNPDANYFVGVSGNFLFIDSGTSAGTRGLEIYNLTTHKSIFSDSYNNDSVKLEQNQFVIYDVPSEKKGLLKNCPKANEWKKNGGGVGWAQGTKLDLNTLKKTSIGGLHCVYVE